MSGFESPSPDRAGRGRRASRCSSLLMGALALALIATPAAADPIILTVNATLSSVFGDLDGPLAPGASVSGTIELDDAVSGVFTPRPNQFARDEMLYAGAIVGSSLMIGGNPISGTGGSIRILDAESGGIQGEDNYEINAVLDTGTIGGAMPVSLQLVAEYGDTTITLSGSDPLFAPPTFDGGRFNPVTLTSGTGGTGFGQMDGLTSTGGPTPTVPTTNAWLMLMLALALAGVGLAGLGRRSAAHL